MLTNYEHYFGTPESVVNVEVKFNSWPISISLYTAEPFSTKTWSSHLIKMFDSQQEYLDWLNAEYKNGDIVFDDSEEDSNAN